MADSVLPNGRGWVGLRPTQGPDCGRIRMHCTARRMLRPYRVCAPHRCINLMAFNLAHALISGGELLGAKADSAFLLPEWG